MPAFTTVLHSGKNPLPNTGKSCINSNSKLMVESPCLYYSLLRCINKRGFEGLLYEQMTVFMLIVVS